MAVPVITASSQTIANITQGSALLGATVTATTGVTETGICISLSSVNAAPVKGGSGVTTLILSPGVSTGGAFTILASGLLPGRNYTFGQYAINATGISTTGAATTFTTLPLPSFGTATSTLPGGETVYVYLRGRTQPVTINQVTQIQAIGQPYLNGTYRDLFNAIGGVTGSLQNWGTVTMDIANPAGSLALLSASDEVAHVNLRQAAWNESGVLFTTFTGLPYRFLDKDMLGWSNALTSTAPTNITS